MSGKGKISIFTMVDNNIVFYYYVQVLCISIMHKITIPYQHRIRLYMSIT